MITTNAMLRRYASKTASRAAPCLPPPTSVMPAKPNADGTLRVLAPNFHRYGKHTMFAGRVKTLKVFEDNSLVHLLRWRTAGHGQVLVVDGAASLRCALLGAIWASWPRKMMGGRGAQRTDPRCRRD